MMKKTRLDDKSLFEAFKNLIGLTRADDGDPTPPAKDPKTGEEVPDPAKGDEPVAGEVDTLKATIEALKYLLADTQKKLEDAIKGTKDATAPETLDALILTRSKLIDAARAILPDVKTDGMKDRDIKLAIIAKALPFDASVKTDACDSNLVDARYEAALAIEREKAAVRGDSSDDSPRLDDAAIEKKRAARLNVMDQK